MVFEVRGKCACGAVRRCRFLGFASGSRCFVRCERVHWHTCAPPCAASAVQCVLVRRRWEGRSCAFPYIQARICLVKLGPREPVKVPRGGMGLICTCVWCVWMDSVIAWVTVSGHVHSYILRMHICTYIEQAVDTDTQTHIRSVYVRTYIPRYLPPRTNLRPASDKATHICMYVHMYRPHRKEQMTTHPIEPSQPQRASNGAMALHRMEFLLSMSVY
jgi:hypothetical protein